MANPAKVIALVFRIRAAGSTPQRRRERRDQVRRILALSDLDNQTVIVSVPRAYKDDLYKLRRDVDGSPGEPAVRDWRASSALDSRHRQ